MPSPIMVSAHLRVQKIGKERQLSKISGVIMIDSHELVLEFSEECVDCQDFEAPDDAGLTTRYNPVNYTNAGPRPITSVEFIQKGSSFNVLAVNDVGCVCVCVCVATKACASLYWRRNVVRGTLCRRCRRRHPLILPRDTVEY